MYCEFILCFKAVFWKWSINHDIKFRYVDLGRLIILISLSLMANHKSFATTLKKKYSNYQTANKFAKRFAFRKFSSHYASFLFLLIRKEKNYLSIPLNELKGNIFYLSKCNLRFLGCFKWYLDYCCPYLEENNTFTYY